METSRSKLVVYGFIRGILSDPEAMIIDVIAICCAYIFSDYVPVFSPPVGVSNVFSAFSDYEERFKGSFFDYFHFDEIEDEICEGEFGVVYKCRRVIVSELKDAAERSESEELDKELYPDDEDESEELIYPGDVYENTSDEDDSVIRELGEAYYAVKKIEKAKLNHLSKSLIKENLELLRQEIEVLEKVQQLKNQTMEGSQYVIGLHHLFEDRNFLYIDQLLCGRRPACAAKSSTSATTTRSASLQTTAR